ncbi:DUF3488 and transglutaminase-like domain-containing protein [Nocardioides maradonensis]
MRPALSASAGTFAVGLVGAATAWLALTSWRGLVTYPSEYLWIGGALGLVLAVVGAATTGRIARGAAIALDAVVCIEVVSWTATGRVLPVHPDALADAVHAAATSANVNRVPISHADPSVTPLLVLGAAGTLFLVQLLAVRLGRAPLAGLAVLAVFALHAGFVGLGANTGSFVGAAAGFLLLLVLDAHAGRQRWNRPDTSARPARPSGLLRSLGQASPVGGVAIAVAVLIGATLPVPRNGLFDLSGADGPAVTIHKPVVDMRSELDTQNDIPLIDVTTEEPNPGYLRIGVLNRFTGAEWSSGDRNVSPDRVADGPVPLGPGISHELGGTDYSLLVHALPAFDSTWLPTAYPISRITADGDWRWDPATMDFVAAGHTNAADETYSMTTKVLDYGTDGRFFRDAPAHSYPDEDIYVPPSVSSFVRQLAAQVTAGSTDDYERALLLQAFFRTTGHFTYSVHRAPQGTDGQVLDTFLRRGPQGRIGFCQQFASAMAIMARIVGIPARVAVGFLTPQQIGPSEYEYSSRDLHAWTELYFAGAGWVRFEPTPSSRAPHPPGYSTVPVALPTDNGGPLGGPSSQPTATPGGEPSALPGAPAPSSKPRQLPGGGAAAQQGHTTTWVLGVLAGIPVVAVLALVVVAAARRRRRAQRLAGDPDEIWAELRATAIDLGVVWPDGRSPRETGRAIAAHLTKGGRRVDPDVLAALDELVLSVEELRYGSNARSVAVAARRDLGARAAAVVRDLEETATPAQRRRARWLPRSLRA